MGNTQVRELTVPSTIRVKGYLGRVLHEADQPVGTCFQVAPQVLVTACHVLSEINAACLDASVLVDGLAPGSSPALGAAVIALDPEHDLAVLKRSEPLSESIGGLVPTDSVMIEDAVIITGHGLLRDRIGQPLRYWDAPGTWAGAALRGDSLRLGQVTSSRVLQGMSGAPVRRLTDDRVVGVLSARYNSVDGWGRDTAWIARTEDLGSILAQVCEQVSIVRDRTASTVRSQLARLLSSFRSAVPQVLQQPGRDSRDPAATAALDLRLLGGCTRIEGDGGPVEVGSDDLVLLTLLVLLAAPTGVAPVQDLRRLLGPTVDGRDGAGEGEGAAPAPDGGLALRHRVARLRRRPGLKDAGLSVTYEASSAGYRVNIDPARVDVLELLRLAAVPARERDEDEVDGLLAAWGDGPDSVMALRFPDLLEPAHDAYEALIRGRRKRILVVDDRVGHHLARLLPEYRCTVVTTLEEFERWEPDLAAFDLALVDIHLTSSYIDHQGLEVVNRIVTSATNVLVLGMTMRPIAGATRDWQRRHDLAELIQKTGDDETADFRPVVEEVRAALRAGPQRQCRSLMEDFVKVTEEAATRLKFQGRATDLPELKADVYRITDRQLDGCSLAELRGLIADFRTRWNVQFNLG